MNTIVDKRRKKHRDKRQKKQAHKNHSSCLVDHVVVLDDLPENCIFDILVRLPLETLICSSMFVCKSWYEIIKSPHFRNAHLHRSDTTTTHGFIFLTPVENDSSPPKKMFSVESNSFLVDLPLSSHMKFMETKDGKSTMKEYNTAFMGNIVAACNGLVVLKNNPGTRLILHNPVTRELEDIPLGTISSMPTETYGLAYCHVSRRYKLLHLFMKDKLMNLCCEIMDIGSGSWRAVDVPPTKPDRGLHNPVFALGALHWIQYVADHGGECMVSMPLNDEKFKTMAIPKTGGHPFHVKSIFAMGEFLGFVGRRLHRQIGVWILKGLGGECGWEKQYNIYVASVLGRRTILLHSGGVNGLGFVCKRHVHGGLTAYDYDRQIATIDTNYWKIFPHVNSLVSWRS